MTISHEIQRALRQLNASVPPVIRRSREFRDAKFELLNACHWGEADADVKDGLKHLGVAYRQMWERYQLLAINFHETTRRLERELQIAKDRLGMRRGDVVR